MSSVERGTLIAFLFRSGKKDNGDMGEKADTFSLTNTHHLAAAVPTCSQPRCSSVTTCQHHWDPLWPSARLNEIGLTHTSE